MRECLASACVVVALTGLAPLASGEAPPAPAAVAEAAFAFPPLGTVHLYSPSGPARQVVVFLSGDGGWNLGVVPMARRLAAEGALVAGVDVRRLVASLRAASPCPYPAGTLEELSRAVQLRARLPEYRPPILVGYSSGATLVYAVLAQAPAGAFRGAISLGFCSDVPTTAPLCRGRGLGSRPLPNGRGRDLEPFAALGAPWTVLHGDADQVCSVAAAERFVAQVPSGRIVRLARVGHGFSVTPRWEPQYAEAYRALAAEPAPAPAVAGPAGATAVRELGLVEVEATSPAARPALADVFAVILTGDGGWAEIDRSIAARFAAAGVPSLGWSSLKYYWTPRTPEAAAADLARVVEHGVARWHRSRVLLVGYSFGADVLPFLANRLSSDARARVARVGLVGLSPRASFEFHVAGWLGLDAGGRSTVPEVKRLAPTPVACVAGDDEADSACGALRGGPVEVVVLPGGHHLGGDYGRVAEALLPAS
jgi:type IV secretory pathway VirJ component